MQGLQDRAVSLRGTRPSFHLPKNNCPYAREVESCWSQLQLGQKQRKGHRREVL